VLIWEYPTIVLGKKKPSRFTKTQRFDLFGADCSVINLQGFRNLEGFALIFERPTSKTNYL